MVNALVRYVAGREPVAVAAVVSALAGLVVAFGADLSEEQTAAITALVIAAVSFAARRVVTPVAKLENPRG
jgi:hypothetical protein